MHTTADTTEEGMRTIVLHPSLALPRWWFDQMGNLDAIEEFMLQELRCLEDERTRIVYLLSQPLPPGVWEYHCGVIAEAIGTTLQSVQDRTTFVVLHDDYPGSFAEKTRNHPQVVEQIRNAIPPTHHATLQAFMPDHHTDWLAKEIGIPLHANPPQTRTYDQKSGTRLLCAEVGVPVPQGKENLFSWDEVYAAWQQMGGTPGPYLVKINNADSGAGTYRIQLDQMVQDGAGVAALVTPADAETIDEITQRIGDVGAALEEFIEAAEKRSPSVQFVIERSGEIRELSVHDQLIQDQHFVGATFPADASYRREIVDCVMPAVQKMASDGVIGPIGVDLLSYRNGPSESWQHAVVECNIRSTSTSIAFHWVQMITHARYEEGRLYAPDGSELYYFQTSGWGVVLKTRYKQMPVHTFIEQLEQAELLYTAQRGYGLIPELLGNLHLPRVTVVMVGKSETQVQQLRQRFHEVFAA